MPIITVEGRALDIEKKRELVAKITEIATQIYNLPKETITVVIKENPPENIGVGGKLIVDLSK